MSSWCLCVCLKLICACVGVFWSLNVMQCVLSSANTKKAQNEWMERCLGWSENYSIPPLPTPGWRWRGGSHILNVTHTVLDQLIIIKCWLLFFLYNFLGFLSSGWWISVTCSVIFEIKQYLGWFADKRTVSDWKSIIFCPKVNGLHMLTLCQ